MQGVSRNLGSGRILPFSIPFMRGRVYPSTLVRSDVQLPEHLNAETLLDIASELLCKGKNVAAKEMVDYALEAIDRITVSQRLKLYSILMQCPEGRFGKSDRNWIAQILDGYRKGGPYDEEDEFRASIIARYCGELKGNDGKGVADRSRDVLIKGEASEEIQRYAHMLLCAYSETQTEWNRSQEALLKGGEEFAITYGITWAVPRYQHPWDALTRLNAALKIVRHPLNRARLFAEKVKTYERLIVTQQDQYDPKVNEQRSSILSDMHFCAGKVLRNQGFYREKVRCFLSLGRVALLDERIADARAKFAQAQEMAELYGFTDLLPKIHREVEKLRE